MNERSTAIVDSDSVEAVAAAFAKPTGEQALVPFGGSSLAAIDSSITAQKVAVARDLPKVLRDIGVMAKVSGEDWYYRWQVNDKNKPGGKGWVEGPSIKCANNVARIYGNCQIDTRVVDNGDTWIIYARFVDLETGFNYTRPFQQRKEPEGGFRTKDKARQLDIALQVGVSKAIRNVVCNALEYFTDFAMQEAQSSIIEKVGKDLDKYRTKVVARLTDMKVAIPRVEATTGRVVKDWLAPDVARIIAEIQSIADGMSTIDETWPPLTGDATPPRPTRGESEKPATDSKPPYQVVDADGEPHQRPTPHEASVFLLDQFSKRPEAMQALVEYNEDLLVRLDAEKEEVPAATIREAIELWQLGSKTGDGAGTTGTVEAEKKGEAAADPDPELIEIPTKPKGGNDWMAYVSLCKPVLKAAPSVAFINAWVLKQGNNIRNLKLSYPGGFLELETIMNARSAELA